MSVQHAGERVVREFLDRLHAGRLEHATELWDDNVRWHVAGANALSGSYRGGEEVLDYLKAVRDATAGTWAVRLLGLTELAGLHVALFEASTGGPAGAAWRRIVVYAVEGGRVTEQWLIDLDQPAADAAFSKGTVR